MLREDLYYRINTIEIRIPPLRERAEDIPNLADHFLKTYSEKYNRPVQRFSQQAYGRMFEYKWNGNVRELQNVIERAVLLSKGETIEETSLPFVQGLSAHAVNSFSESISTQTVVSTTQMSSVTDEKTTALFNSSAEKAEADKLQASQLSLEEIGKIIVSQLSETNTEEGEDIFNHLEASVVIAALERTKGNKQAAANLLGLYRPRLYGMIKRHNIEER